MHIYHRPCAEPSDRFITSILCIMYYSGRSSNSNCSNGKYQYKLSSSIIVLYCMSLENPANVGHIYYTGAVLAI